MINKPDFNKLNGLIPAIVQDARTGKVLMLGFMNTEAYQKTLDEKKVTFYSRTKGRLWTKGEITGHFLEVKHIALDCDQDTVLIQATPQGATCHTGADTCWFEDNTPFTPLSESPELDFISHLEQIISRRKFAPDEKSYTSSLFKKGLNKIAQKVGEEAVELIIESKDDNKELFLGEAADLLFHYLILLQAKGYRLHDVVEVLRSRHK